MTEPAVKNKRRLEGVVVSDKMSKTRVVLIERLRPNAKYRKYEKVSTRFKAHDETNQYKAGDRVVIEEIRPISRHKRWTIIRKIEHTAKNT